MPKIERIVNISKNGLIHFINEDGKNDFKDYQGLRGYHNFYDFVDEIDSILIPNKENFDFLVSNYEGLKWDSQETHAYLAFEPDYICGDIGWYCNHENQELYISNQRRIPQGFKDLKPTRIDISYFHLYTVELFEYRLDYILEHIDKHQKYLYKSAYEESLNKNTNADKEEDIEEKAIDKARDIYSRITSYTNQESLGNIDREWIIQKIKEGLIEWNNEK